MEATIKQHPKFNRGERVKIVRELPFNCYVIAGNLNHTENSATYYAHKNELYIPEITFISIGDSVADKINSVVY